MLQSTNINYVSLFKYIPITVIIASIIIIFITTSVSGENGVISLIAGYSGLLAGLFFFIVIVLLNLGSFKLSYIVDFFPMLLVITTIVVTLIYISKYSENIANEHVPYEYYTYSYISVILILLQLWFIISAMKNSDQNTLELFKQPIYSLVCLLWTINIIVVIILCTLLQFYNTNG
jgi:hypothetical protein